MRGDHYIVHISSGGEWMVGGVMRKLDFFLGDGCDALGERCDNGVDVRDFVMDIQLSYSAPQVRNWCASYTWFDVWRV